MSEKPPKKKLRQASITDMFKATKDKETAVMDVPVNDKKSEERFLKSESDASLTKGTASSSNNLENIEDKSMEWEKFPQLSDDQHSNGDGHLETDKSPPKSVNKYPDGKSKKKKKHTGDPRVKGSSSSRDGDHKCSWNTVLRENSDSKDNASEISKKSGDISPSKIAWRGCLLSSLKVLTVSDQIMPTVHPSSDHSVMVKVPLTTSELPEPHPSMYTDIWDQYHVRMPCSPKSLYPIGGHGSDSLVPRWSVITKALQRTIRSVKDLQRAILEYNSRYAEKWHFKGLQHLLEEEFEEDERLYFFNETLPDMIKLALDLPNLVTLPPPLLTRHSTHSITLSQIQIASLLANAFFCTFPRRNAKGGDTEYASYPDINFNRLYFHKEQRSLEKLKCLLNYFRRVTKKRPDGLVTFTRQHISWSDLPKWETSSHHLPELHISSTGLIEEMRGLLQVDFANKYLGGGVLGLGCVQEEIRFVLSPELLVSRLFTQVLDKTDALIITGTELYNCSSGYASTFRWSRSYQDTTPRDTWRRRLCQVVAIDALHFSHQKAQYKPNLILRELNKAYAGFRVLKGGTGIPIGVATGNWGCGAFNGNPRLKSLIQLAACGYSGRDVAYFTFGDEKLRNDIATMHIFLRENNVTVGELVQLLVQYGQRDWSDGSDLYEYIYHNLGRYDSDTDNENVETKGSSCSTEKPKTSLKKQGTCGSEKPSRSVSDYFKKTETHCSATLKGIDEHSNSNHQSASVPKTSEKMREGNLTEQKIEQVLKECDRLVEGQKKKNQENSSGKVEKHIDSNIIYYNSDNNDDTKSETNIISEENMKEKRERDIIKTSKSSSEPVNLLSCLDKIDKQTESQT